MNPLEFQLKQLVKLMKDAKVDYAILGGVAVSIYGEPRLTFDIDVNILLNVSKIDSFVKRAKMYGFLPLISRKFIKATSVMPMEFSKNKIKGKIDFIIAQNALEYSGIKRAILKKINNFKIKLVTPEDLIIHKITSQRPRDIEDVQGILLRQNKKIDFHYINFWLKRICEVNKKPELLRIFKHLLMKKERNLKNV